MVNLDTRSIAKELDYYGTNVTLNIVSNVSVSNWGDDAETISTATKTAFVQVLTQENQLVREGVFQAGDKLFWFKGNETGISRGNKIIHGAKLYEIMEIIEHDVAGTTYILEARTKKI